MTLRFFVWALLLFTAAPATRYERSVQPATGGEICVGLPVEVLAHAAPGLRDLRVTADGQEVPYQLRVSGEGAASESAHAEQILNLGDRDGGVSFDAVMTEPHYSRVALHLGRAAFSVLVHVSGTDRAGEPGVAFPEFAWSASDAEQGNEQRIITLPESSFRYLHFELKTLAFDPVRPQDVAGVDVFSATPLPVVYSDVAPAGAPLQKSGHSVYEFAVPANAPVEQVQFSSADPRAIFTRDATLERPGERGESPESSALVVAQTSRSNRAGDAGVVAVLFAPAPAASKVTLTIDNGDDAPLSLTSLRLQMRERQVCFLSRAGASYALRYGNASLAAPRYDISPIEAAASTASLTMLGPERMVAEGADADLRPFTERHPMLLWVALIAAVATLGVVALRSARRSA